MATCPSCGVKGYEDPARGDHAFTVTLEAAHVGESHLGQVEIQMEVRHRLTCNSCGWSIAGTAEDQSFRGIPSTQTFPPKPGPCR